MSKLLNVQRKILIHLILITHTANSNKKFKIVIKIIARKQIFQSLKSLFQTFLLFHYI